MTTITIDRALLEQALDELLPISHNSTDDPRGRADKAIALIRAELAKPVGAEPVACVVETESGVMVWPIADYNEASTYCDDGESPSLLYLHPPTPARHDAPETIALKAERDELLAALREAMDAVKTFHGPNCWDIYEKNSPEMARWRAAIAKAEGGTE